MKKITILIPVISLFLFSCGNTSNEKSKEQTETANHDEEGEAKDETEAEKQFQNIQTSFTAFNQYFQ